MGIRTDEDIVCSCEKSWGGVSPAWMATMWNTRKIKGVQCNAMPRSWYDSHALPPGGDEKSDMIRDLYSRIVADKKPYFMRYIYPKLMSDYNNYVKKTNMKCLMEFGMRVEELERMQDDARTEDQKQFLKYYYSRLPVSNGDCVLNRLCRKVEAFVSDAIKPNLGDKDFDYSFMKSGNEYTKRQYNAVLSIYNDYRDAVQQHRINASQTKKIRSYGRTEEMSRQIMLRPFLSKCYAVCSDERQLCDIIIDVCYKHEGTKQFVWDMCGRVIAGNLFAKNGGTLEYPRLDENGDIEYAGSRFSMTRKESTRWLTSL